MSRKKKTISNTNIYRKSRNRIFGDPKYSNYYIGKFINMIMLSGKKSIASNIVYKVIDLIKNTYNTNPIGVFLKSLSNACPVVEVKKKKVGGSFIFVPVRIKKSRGLFIAMRLIVSNSRKRRKGSEFYISLFKEIIETYNGESNTINDKNNIHRKSESNRAFSHFVF